MTITHPAPTHPGPTVTATIIRSPLDIEHAVELVQFFHHGMPQGILPLPRVAALELTARLDEPPTNEPYLTADVVADVLAAFDPKFEHTVDQWTRELITLIMCASTEQRRQISGAYAALVAAVSIGDGEDGTGRLRRLHEELLAQTSARP
ncbi:hypothetical protein [Nonomuraea sp. NPDC050310]|uniref:hypothetical protein n=1 Tax=Nonomuraea sp. NPDC050310 TaxID=3154935 RepID=UPI0034015967